MIKKYFIGLWDSQNDSRSCLTFLETLKDWGQNAFILNIQDLAKKPLDDTETPSLDGYITWKLLEPNIPHIYLTQDMTGDKTSFFIEDIPSFFDNSRAVFDLMGELMKLGNRQPKWLETCPLHASWHSPDGKLLASNQKPQDPYDFFDHESKQELPIAAWIIQELNTDPSRDLHMPLASMSNQQILIQTYRLIKDEQGIMQGILQQVQDIKPHLSAYLKESGQAIVGWSDVTSGASIHNDSFDFED